MFTVVIVEDNKFFSDALEKLLSEIENAAIIAVYTNAETAIKEIVAYSPDVVIVDIQLKDKLNGIDIIKQVKPLLKTTEFLVCTAHDDSNWVFDALKSGAAGYILKDANADEIKSAILEVTKGGAPMSPFIARKVISSFRDIKPEIDCLDNKLTKREKEVVKLLSTGMLYKEIAHTLDVTHSTVKKHIRNIYEKLHVQNKVEALNKYRYL